MFLGRLTDPVLVDPAEKSASGRVIGAGGCSCYLDFGSEEFEEAEPARRRRQATQGLLRHRGLEDRRRSTPLDAHSPTVSAPLWASANPAFGTLPGSRLV